MPVLTGDGLRRDDENRQSQKRSLRTSTLFFFYWIYAASPLHSLTCLCSTKVHSFEWLTSGWKEGRTGLVTKEKGKWTWSGFDMMSVNSPHWSVALPSLPQPSGGGASSHAVTALSNHITHHTAATRDGQLTVTPSLWFHVVSSSRDAWIASLKPRFLSNFSSH